MDSMSQRERMARARRVRAAARSYHRGAGISDGWANVIALAILLGFIVLVLIVINAFDPGAKNNITCKGTNGVQYWLCVAGQAQRQYVSYSLWRSAVVGGYYDEGRRSVFRDVGEDPAAPHGFLHELGHIGGEGHGAGHGGGR